MIQHLNVPEKPSQGLNDERKSHTDRGPVYFRLTYHHRTNFMHADFVISQIWTPKSFSGNVALRWIVVGYRQREMIHLMKLKRPKFAVEKALLEDI